MPPDSAWTTHWRNGLRAGSEPLVDTLVPVGAGFGFALGDTGARVAEAFAAARWAAATAAAAAAA